MKGYESDRFRDRNSLLLQGEWRIMVNRFIDTALFYDAGKVASHTSDLDLNGLTHDYGAGVRFHSPFSTMFRVDVARSPEGLRLVFASSAAF
jgi:outer membrane translocation and assembly module TamA